MENRDKKFLTEKLKKEVYGTSADTHPLLERNSDVRNDNVDAKSTGDSVASLSNNGYLDSDPTEPDPISSSGHIYANIDETSRNGSLGYDNGGYH